MINKKVFGAVGRILVLALGVVSGTAEAMRLSERDRLIMPIYFEILALAKEGCEELYQETCTEMGGSLSIPGLFVPTVVYPTAVSRSEAVRRLTVEMGISSQERCRYLYWAVCEQYGYEDVRVWLPTGELLDPAERVAAGITEFTSNDERTFMALMGMLYQAKCSQKYGTDCIERVTLTGRPYWMPKYADPNYRDMSGYSLSRKNKAVRVEFIEQLLLDRRVGCEQTYLHECSRFMTPEGELMWIPNGPSLIKENVDPTEFAGTTWDSTVAIARLTLDGCYMSYAPRPCYVSDERLGSLALPQSIYPLVEGDMAVRSAFLTEAHLNSEGDCETVYAKECVKYNAQSDQVWLPTGKSVEGARPLDEERMSAIAQIESLLFRVYATASKEQCTEITVDECIERSTLFGARYWVPAKTPRRVDIQGGMKRAKSATETIGRLLASLNMDDNEKCNLRYGRECMGMYRSDGARFWVPLGEESRGLR